MRSISKFLVEHNICFRIKTSRRDKLASYLLTLLVSLLAACSTVPSRHNEVSIDENRSLPVAIPSFVDERPAIIESNDIYRLSEEHERDFLAYYRNPDNQKVPGHERIVHYLKTKASAFVYGHETRTADEVFHFDGGNCLSLANATTALARLVHVRVVYQYMDDLPIYEKQENIILRGAHVRSVLYRPSPVFDAQSNKGTKVLTPNPSRVIVDYFPTGRSRFISKISESEFTAMYYRNLAVDTLAEEDYSRTYWLVKESMLHAPDHPDSLNMLAILYRRNGDDQTAEQIYLYGIEKSTEKLSLLKNYRTLLNRQGRTANAEQINLKIAEYEDADPFEWWSLAEGAYKEENFSDALSYYKKSVEIAPYLHEGYFGMAKTYYQMGSIDSAESAMASAVENASRKEFRDLYEVKLEVLSKHK